MNHLWKAWREHFESQKNRPFPILVKPYGLPEEWNRALIHSLARFQVGESGEGRIAREIDHVHSPVIDSDYRQALKMFVLEEGRHAHILAEMVREMGGSLLQETWTNQLFRWGRRQMGIRLKLLVLLVAEIVGVGFYSFLKNRLPSGTFRAALKEIINDESLHLSFHTEYFRRELTRPLEKIFFLGVWWTVALAACTVVYLDHRFTWKAFDLPFASSALRLLTLIHQTAQAALGVEPLEPSMARRWVAIL